MPEDRTALETPGGVSDAVRTAAHADFDTSRVQSVVGIVVGLGVVLCCAAVVIGIRMALHATVVPCPNGTIFPDGTTDFRCFAHDHAGEGSAIAIFAVVQGGLLGIGGLLATMQLRRQRSR